MRRARLLLLVLLAAALGSTGVGLAYVVNNWWPDATNIVMDDVFLPAATWSSPAQFQMSEWNEVDVTDNSHPFRINANPQFSFGANDGDNTIGFLGEAGLNSEYGLSYASALAWTACWSSGTIVECDVMLDPTLPWSLGPDDSEWFQSTVLHELGHVRGLGHYNNYLSMQNSGQSKYLRNEILYMDDKEGVRQHASHVSERDIVMYNKWHNGATPQWMSMSPTSLREGQVVNLSNITVENRGTIAFGNLRFGTYLSTNSTISTGDTLLNTGSWASFPRFNFSTFNWSATIPTVSDCGVYYLGGIIDDNAAYDERFEGNNDTVFTNGVPFTGSTFNPTELNINLRLDLQEPNNTLGTAGTIVLPYSNASLSIDQDSAVDFYRFVVPATGAVTVSSAFTHALGNVDLQLLNSAGTVLQTSAGVVNNESITRVVTAGTYYARVYGTGTGSCNRYSLNVTFVEHRPDLVMTALNAPATAVPGQTISVANTVQNTGLLAAGAFRVGFYLSTNNICSTGDTFLTSRAVGPLGVGASSGLSTAVPIPGGAGSLGSRWLCAIADDLAAVLEESEANNSLFDPIEIIAKPDLVVSALAGPAVASPGQTISVSNTVRNDGLLAAGASRVGFYLSDDTRCVLGDSFMGSRAVPALAVGGTSAQATNVTIPSGATLGSKTLCAIADDLAAVDESIESNNDRGTPIQILSAVPSVNLEINGLDPASKIVPVAGNTRLTLDMAPNAYSSSAQWYWAIIYGGVTYWVTPGGLVTVPTPLAAAVPATLNDLELLNTALPAGDWTFVFFLFDGTNILAIDWITASVAP